MHGLSTKTLRLCYCFLSTCLAATCLAHHPRLLFQRSALSAALLHTQLVTPAVLQRTWAFAIVQRLRKFQAGKAKLQAWRVLQRMCLFRCSRWYRKAVCGRSNTKGTCNAFKSISYTISTFSMKRQESGCRLHIVGVLTIPSCAKPTSPAPSG